MIINGAIEEIIYRNEENGYSVVVLSSNGETISAVGKFPHVVVGANVELVGSFVKHKRYGQQFSATKATMKKPTTIDGIIKYLSSGLIKGVGVITATAIVNKFGADTLDVIELNHTQLATVRGVSMAKAQDIYQSFSEVKKMQQAIMLMQDYEISTNMAVKIYNTYFGKTEQILTTNAYKLCEDVDGIGFATADKIAQKMGVEKNCNHRVRAGVLHMLKVGCDQTGNTFVPLTNLQSDVCELLRVMEQEVDMQTVLNGLVIDSFIKITELDGDKIVALNKHYNTEKVVAYTLTLLNDYYKSVNNDVSDIMNLFEQMNKISMHDNQRQAVATAVNSGVSVITGGPGTGKTTIVKCMLQVFKSMKKKVKLLAPTGRAAKRLTQSTGEDASTIHRALVVDFLSPNKFQYNQNNKLEYDVIIVDEVSMVDIQLMHFLIRALKKGTQLVLVGDKDQLPSVGVGNVLSDIIASGVVGVSELTYIYRQDKDSLIITNAHAINSGNMPILDNKSSDFFFENKAEPEQMLNAVVGLSCERLPKFLNIDNSKIQVLSAMKSGLCGVSNLNKQLQAKINPPSFNKPEVVTEWETYRLNDRVMQTTNNYEREWINGSRQSGLGVFNGDIGVIDHIETNTDEITVLFEDGRYAKYNKKDSSELMLSYAITIHKSQGSEFDVVVIPVVSGAPMLLTKNLLYTAVTRAKKTVVLVGAKQSIARMVKNNYTQQRNTLLKQFLIECSTLEGIVNVE